MKYLITMSLIMIAAAMLWGAIRHSVNTERAAHYFQEWERCDKDLNNTWTNLKDTLKAEKKCVDALRLVGGPVAPTKYENLMIVSEDGLVNSLQFHDMYCVLRRSDNAVHCSRVERR
jgi:hypothetical protein